MDVNTITEEVKFNAHLIATIINECEEVQKSDESQHTKECAKITAYEHIIELIVGRGE